MSFTSKTRIVADVNKIKPTKNNVIVTEMEFGDRLTVSGLILPGDDSTERGIRPRWAQVLAVGEKNLDVTVGQWVLVEHGRWTRGIDVTNPDTEESTTIRMVDPKDIILVSDEQPQDEFVAISYSYTPDN